MLEFIFLSVLWVSCVGQQFGDPRNKPFRSPPIGIDDPLYSGLGRGPRASGLSAESGSHFVVPPSAPEDPNDKNPKQPAWVGALINNMNEIQKSRGGRFDDVGRAALKDLIHDFNTKVYGDRALRTKSDSVSILRSYTDQHYAVEEKELDDQAFARDMKWEPRWEKDLKNYIKNLIAQYGKSHLDDYVRPVVTEIEASNNINIRDIDVNPYGEVSVNWKANPKLPPPPAYEERPRDNSVEVAPEIDYFDRMWSV